MQELDAWVLGLTMPLKRRRGPFFRDMTFLLCKVEITILLNYEDHVI